MNHNEHAFKMKYLANLIKKYSELNIFPDMGKTFGPLPDRRTGNHMENPSFTGPPKCLQDLIFFNIRIPIEWLPTGIFFTGKEDRHNKGFHRSSTVFTGRGPVDFRMSVFPLSEIDRFTGVLPAQRLRTGQTAAILENLRIQLIFGFRVHAVKAYDNFS